MTVFFEDAWKLVVVAGCFAATTVPTSATVVQNGAFSDGLAGYTVERCVRVDPCPADNTNSAEVVDGAGGNPFLALRAPTYVLGPGQIQVSQTVEIHVGQAELSFDVGLLSVEDDPFPAGSSVEDFFTLFIQTPTDSFTPFIYDVDGPRISAINRLQDVSVEDTSIPNMPGALSAANFTADLSQFAGSSLTLIFTTVSRSDGRVTEFGLDNIAFTGPGLTPVPLPAGGTLLVAVLALLAGLRRRQLGHTRG